MNATTPTTDTPTTDTPPTLAPALVGRLRDLVVEHYVFPEVATTIGDALATVAARDEDVPAALLTARMQETAGDRHLRVIERSTAEWHTNPSAHARRTAGGVRTVTRLDERTGLLAIAPFTATAALAEPYVAAAFALLQGVDRLVVDLREGRGGDPDTVAMICGYLLGPEPVHLHDLVERDGTVRQFWTRPAAARLPDDVAIRVLTGSDTFSACEELAYDLRTRDRARVVGEPTRGGAHPVEVFDLGPTYDAAIPVARSVSAVTGTNWEGAGVHPDLPCEAGEALDRALADLAS